MTQPLFVRPIVSVISSCSIPAVCIDPPESRDRGWVGTMSGSGVASPAGRLMCTCEKADWGVVVVVRG